MNNTSAPETTMKSVAISSWPPLAIVALHAILAAVFGHQRWLDPVLHFFGGAAALYCCSHFLQTTFRLKTKSVLPLYLVAIIVLLWEVGEFLSDRFLGTHVQHGVLDTGSDILLGIFGALLYFISTQRKTKAPESQLT